MKNISILKDLREDFGLSQLELSKKLGISQSAVSAYEKGDREPIAKVLALYADFFNVSVDYLLGREDDFGNIVQNTKKESSINKEDREMLELIKNISPYQREALMIYLKTLKEKA